MRKDMTGNEVNTGDILLEIGRGWGNDGKGNETFSIKLWQLPSSTDGSGYQYAIDGRRSKYYWANTQRSLRVDMKQMPEGFEYAFFHGMSDLDTSIEYGTVPELINKSNWEKVKVTEEQVRKYDLLAGLQLETEEDVEKNIDLLAEGHIPSHIVSKVLDIYGFKKRKAKNGEIGIASLFNMMSYSVIMRYIREKEQIIDNETNNQLNEKE